MTLCYRPGSITGLPNRVLIALAFVTAVNLSLADTRPADSGIEGKNRAIVSEAFEKWQEGESVFAELLAPDVVWTIHGSGPVAGTYRSLEDFASRASAPLLNRFATPLVPEVHDIWTDGSKVIIRFDGAATTTSGAPYNNQFVWIFHMQDGRVTEAEAFLDLVAYQEVIDNNEPRSDTSILRDGLLQTADER